MKAARFVLALVLAGLTGIASAATIYVDAAATGAGDGTSWADAYTSIQAAVDSAAFTATSDATILVASGTYNELVTLAADNGGASGAPNRIQANTSGAVVINGGATRANGIAATGVSWLELDGLSVTNATAEGIKFLSLSTNNVLTNVSSCGNTGVGLLLRDGFNFTISGGSYAHNRSDGIAFENTDNSRVVGAAIHGNRYNGIRGGTNNSGTYESDNITVERCAVFQNGLTLGSSFKNTGNSGSQSSGIALQHNSKCTGWVVTNCVLYANTQSGLYNWETCSSTVFDTIIAYNGTLGIALANHSSVTVVASRTAFWGNGLPYTTTTRLTLNSPYAVAPSFVAGDRGDFRLYADSDCQALGDGGTDLGLYPAGSVVALPTVETYYVRSDGSDANTGLSNDASGAVLTLAKAASLTTPGDTVRVQPGVYDTFTLTASGTADSPVRFVADGAVTVTGTVAAATIDRASWNVLDGLCFSNATHGIRLDFASESRVTNCIVARNTSYGVFVNESAGLTMVDSQVIWNGSHGIHFYGKGASRIERCHIARNTGSGIYGGANLAAGRRLANYVTLYRCSIFANNAHGICLEGDSYCSNWTVDNCTVVYNGGSGMTAGHWCSGNVLRNSIMCFNRGNGVGPAGTSAGIACTYNNVFGNTFANYSGFTAGTGSISADPLLVNPGATDFHLFVGSPSIDTGLAGIDMGVWPDGAGVPLPGAATYYVRTDGSDSNSGLANTPGGAFLTIQKAASTVGANGTVRVQPGTYNESVFVSLVAPSSLQATFVADGAVQVTGGGHAFLLDVSAGIVLDGFAVTGGAGSDGVRLSASRNCVLTNLTAASSGTYGIQLLNSPNNVVAHCLATNNTSHGLYLYAANYTTVHDSTFGWNKQNGIYAGPNNSAAGSDNVVLRRSRFLRNTGSGVALQRDSYSDNWIIDACLAYGNYGSGIDKGAWNSGMVLTNSILAVNHQYDLYPDADYGTGVRVSYTCFYAARNHFVPGVKHFIDGGNNLWADPGFVAPWANDFRLYEGAPAAGYGINGEDLGPSPSGPRVALPPIQTYYVRLDGSDANTGLDNTPAGAFLTLQKAADVVTPGDTVRVQAGAYAESVTIATGGSGDWWATFIADGAVAVTNASGPALSMQGANRVAFKGITFTAANGNGVEMNEAQGCRFENCALTGSKLAGAFLNRSHEAEFVNTSISGNQANGALLYLSGETFFDRCRIFGNTGTGVYSGRYGGPSIGGAIWGVVRNSLVYQNTGYGFSTARDSASHNWIFENSVFDGNGGGIHVNYFGGDATMIRNTAVTFNTGDGIYRETQYTLNVINCDVHGNGLNYRGTITPVNSISADPLYRSRATGNFHILAASPCVDVGLNQPWMAKGEPTAFDLDGNPRIANGVVDIGAYEVYTAPTMLIVR